MQTTPTSTLERFTPWAGEFVRGLYTEHLGEVSFLYDQRNYFFEHPQFTHKDYAWNEERCDRHLDALVGGGELAFDLCATAAAGSDAGELYAALRVFCRANQPERVKQALDVLDVSDEARRAAAQDALKHELPAAWSAEIREWLGAVEEPVAAILAVASVYRGLELTTAIQAIAARSLRSPAPFLWALGRLGDPSSVPVLQKALVHEDDEVKQTAAIAALRSGNEEIALPVLQSSASEHPWAAVPLAMLGRLSEFPRLKSLAASVGPHRDTALALGLLGHAGAVEILLSWLETEEVADSAALALHLLTGEYPEEEESILSTERERWLPIGEDFASRVKADTPLRLGDEDSPLVTLHAFFSPRLNRRSRDALSDILSIRHGRRCAAVDIWDLPKEADSGSR